MYAGLLSYEIKTVKFLIVEDHHLFSDLLQFWISQNYEHPVEVKVVKSIQEFKNIYSGFNPSYIILDLFLDNGEFGNDILSLLSKTEVQNVMVITSVREPKPLYKKEMKNVRVIINKSSPKEEFMRGLMTLLGTGSYRCSKTIEIMNKQSIPTITDNNGKNLISDREREVLNLIAKGNTSKVIAEKLFISFHTVETHRKNLLKKFGVRTMSNLIQIANNNEIL